MLYCILLLSCLLSPPYFPLLPGGLSHSTVNTDSDCGGMIGNVNCSKLVSLFWPAGVICLQSSLFALPSRGSAGLCRVTSGLVSASVCLQSSNLLLPLSFQSTWMNSVWSVEWVFIG